MHYEKDSTLPAELRERGETPDAQARMTIWRRRVTTIERDPELAALIDTMGDLATPAATFDEDREKYAGIAATANDYLGFGHFSHCAHCYQSIALFPAHKLDFPEMTPHECSGLAAFREWDRDNTASRVRQAIVGSDDFEAAAPARPRLVRT